MTPPAFDPLERFAEVERLVSKIYLRFSHLFFDRPELRDFWWEMGLEEEQHSSILLACRDVIENYEDEELDPSVTQDKVDEFKEKLNAFLQRGTPSLAVEEAFRIALEIETSEIDAIYGKLLQLGGPKIAQTMQNLGVPASVQRQKLKAALRRFCSDPNFLAAAERL
jgi:rubrerythrin